MIEDRPKIAIPTSTFDKAVELIGLLFLIAFWVFVVWAYSQLGDKIPIHFNFKGEVDRYGSKNSLFLLPIIATICYGGLSFLNRYPHIFNYTSTITEENAARQYTYATQLLRLLKVIIVLIFLIITIFTFLAGKGLNNHLGSWFVPMVLVMLFLPTGYYLYKSVRSK